MRLFFVAFFSFFSLFIQAQVLIPGPAYEYDFNQFDWQAFSDPANIQKHIDFRNITLELLDQGVALFSKLKTDKIDLVRIEQELTLYRQGIKAGLSFEDIQRAERAIKLHKDNIESIESVILERGFSMVGAFGTMPEHLAYRAAAGDLFQTDYRIVFDLVEKRDARLFLSGGANDEAYAKLILPQVKHYTEKMGEISQNYYDSLWSVAPADVEPALSKGHINTLVDMYSGSRVIYNCFLKNFQNPTGASQQALKGIIQGWYEQQSEIGARGLIEAYRRQTEEVGPWFTVIELNKFKAKVPAGVKVMVSDFYKNDIINHPDFIDTEESSKLGARVDALIGLKYLGVLDEEGNRAERELFERALEAGIIERLDKGNVFFGYNYPIP